MRHHQAANRGMGVHGSVLGQGDADLLHVKQCVQQEIDGLVGQRRIAHGGTNALILLLQQLGNGKRFIGSISPCFFAHIFVQLLRACFGKPVRQCLYKEMLVGVVLVEFFGIRTDGGGEKSYDIGDAGR